MDRSAAERAVKRDLDASTGLGAPLSSRAVSEVSRCWRCKRRSFRGSRSLPRPLVIRHGPAPEEWFDPMRPTALLDA